MSSRSRFVGSTEEYTHNITTCNSLYARARCDEKSPSQTQVRDEEDDENIKKKRRVEKEKEKEKEEVVQLETETQYLVHTSLDTISSDIPALLLSVTDAIHVWMVWLDIQAFKVHRESLGIPSTSWNDLFTLFRSAFERDDKLTVTIPPVSSSSRSSPRPSTPSTIRLHCTYTLEEVELLGSFVLHEVGASNMPNELSFSLSALHNTSTPSLWRCHTLQNVMFQLLDRVRHPDPKRRTMSDDGNRGKDRRIAELETELSSVRAELSRLHELQSHMPSHDAHHSPTLTSSPTAKKKTHIPRTNMSILNPGQKKRKQKGVKIQ